MRGMPASVSGNRTFVSTRAQGINVGAWNTNAMRRPAPPVSANGLPHQDKRPVDGWSRPAIRLNSVDLPQPEGPTSARNSPRRTQSVTSESACVRLSNVLPTRTMSTIGASAAAGCFMSDGPSRAGVPATVERIALRYDAHCLDQLERVRAFVVGARLGEAGSAQELDRRLPSRIRHRQQAELARLAARHDAVLDQLAHAVREQLVGHFGIACLDQRVTRLRIRKIAAPAFRGSAQKAFQCIRALRERRARDNECFGIRRIAEIRKQEHDRTNATLFDRERLGRRESLLR